MKEIWSTVINEYSSKTGLMFTQHNEFTFNDLVNWVLRNCTSADQIIYNCDRDVQAIYPSRIEKYYFKNQEVHNGE